jgi:hypothetical protein
MLAGTIVLRFYASHVDEEGAQRSFQVMFYPGEQCVEVNEVSVWCDGGDDCGGDDGGGGGGGDGGGGGGGGDVDTSVYDAAVSCSVLL